MTTIEFTEPGSCPVCGSVGGDHDDECPKIRKESA